MNDTSTVVLVTGGSGFVGSHVILQLLAAGHEVRTTVRSLSREASVRAMLKDAGADANARLSFFAADLERDEGWPAAIAGCDFVIHVASPMPRVSQAGAAERARSVIDAGLTPTARVRHNPPARFSPQWRVTW